MVKRRSRHQGEFGRATARVYRWIEALNVAAIAGLALACIGYLWANRLLPLELAHRHDGELAAFFGLWLLALMHGLCRPPAAAWKEQLAALAALCLLLPVLNGLTVGDHVLAQIDRGDWESAGVELVALSFGVLALLALRAMAQPRAARAPVDQKMGQLKPQEQRERAYDDLDGITAGLGPGFCWNGDPRAGHGAPPWSTELPLGLDTLALSNVARWWCVALGNCRRPLRAAWGGQVGMVAWLGHLSAGALLTVAGLAVMPRVVAAAAPAATLAALSAWFWAA